MGTHINLLLFIAQLEVPDQRLLLQGFQEHKVLHPHRTFQKGHVQRRYWSGSVYWCLLSFCGQ